MVTDHGMIDAEFPISGKEAVGAGWTESQAVVDGNVVTSQGPGTSLQFALKLVEILFSKEKAKEIADQMLTKMAVERVGF